MKFVLILTVATALMGTSCALAKKKDSRTPQQVGGQVKTLDDKIKTISCQGVESIGGKSERTAFEVPLTEGASQTKWGKLHGKDGSIAYRYTVSVNVYTDMFPNSALVEMAIFDAENQLTATAKESVSGNISGYLNYSAAPQKQKNTYLLCEFPEN